MFGGWHQIAFESELDGDVTPAFIGSMPLILVRRANAIRTYYGVCPHRGANLGFGGRLEGVSVVCPFHGHHIALGDSPPAAFNVREYPTLGYGGMIFARLSQDNENGLEAFLQKLSQNHVFVPGFTMRVPADATLVVENAFDSSHFQSVHKIDNDPQFSITLSSEGAFIAEGVFRIPPSSWHETSDHTEVPFIARAFSPNLVISSFGGAHPYTVFTASSPAFDIGSVVRLSLAVPRGSDNSLPEIGRCRDLVEQCRDGLQSDVTIWTHMLQLDHPKFVSGDACVVAFQKFCARFAGPLN